MSNFMHVIKEASQHRLAKEVNYKKIRQERWQELKALAEESDLLLDGRRTRHKRQASA